MCCFVSNKTTSVVAQRVELPVGRQAASDVFVEKTGIIVEAVFVLCGRNEAFSCPSLRLNGNLLFRISKSRGFCDRRDSQSSIAGADLKISG